MAGRKSNKPKSAVMLAFEAAKKNVSTAKEANKKLDNEKTKAALETAKATLKTASAAAARERFLTVGGARVSTALDKLKNLERVANPKSYTFTKADADELVAAINDAAKAIENAFKRAVSEPGATTAEAKKVFTFTSAAK